MPQTTDVYRLDEIADIPTDIAVRLKPHEKRAMAHTHVGELLEGPGFASIAGELDARILAARVRAFHCTKEPFAGFFESRGLRPLSMEQHHRDFDALIRQHVSGDLRARFAEAHERFRLEHTGRREGMVWLCASRHLVQTGETGLFFTYFGGEAVYWPFLGTGSECERFLAGFGRPVVVEAEIPASDLHTFSEYPFARDLLSHWAADLNPEFHTTSSSLEGFLVRAVDPGEIVEVHPANRFGWTSL